MIRPSSQTGEPYRLGILLTGTEVDGLHSSCSLAAQQVVGSKFRPYVPRTCDVLHVSAMESAAVVLQLPDAVTGTSVVELSMNLRSLSINPSAPASVASVAVSLYGAIPSGRRIHCVTQWSGSLCAADDKGNVFVLAAGDAAADDGERPAKRCKTECDEKRVWNEVLSSSSSEPMRGAFPPHGCAGGWVGVCSIGASGASSPSMIVAREHFNDVRLADVTTSRCVRSWYTTHQPTGAASMGTGGGSELVVVADGPLLTLFDIRCWNQRSPVLRVTSTGGAFHTARALSENTFVACHSDRSVSVFDTRALASKKHVVSAVLKHDVWNVTPIGIARDCVVCTGIDSELRIINLSHPSSAREASTDEGTRENEALPSVSSFRSRLNESVHCNGTWHGSWAFCAGAKESEIAMGLSSSNELFAATLALGGANDE